MIHTCKIFCVVTKLYQAFFSRSYAAQVFEKDLECLLIGEQFGYIV